jgi:hypothetical protein
MPQPRRRLLYRSNNFFFAHGILQKEGNLGVFLVLGALES